MEHMAAQDTLSGLRPSKVANLHRRRKPRETMRRVLHPISGSSHNFRAGLLALTTFPAEAWSMYSIHNYAPRAVSIRLSVELEHKKLDSEPKRNVKSVEGSHRIKLFGP
jgi:hypothetical protein